ncbi:hypothetical protein GEMRC1_001779 [Eukaryota sp. GEM-RC1]
MSAIIVEAGSFNPPTRLHISMLARASHCLTQKEINVSKLLISPVSDHYAKPTLSSLVHRIAMLKLALKDAGINAEIDLWETQQPRYMPSLFLLNHVQHQNPSDTIYLVIGADIVRDMALPGNTCWPWCTLKPLLQNYSVIVIERGDIDIGAIIQKSRLEPYRHKFILCGRIEEAEDPVSSTRVREMCSRSVERETIERYIYPSVFEYIQREEIYQKSKIQK